MSEDDQVTKALPDGPPGELPVGAELNGGQYKIVRNIAAGGFGITYLAKDNLNRDVALKECFPLGLVARTTSRSVSAASESTAASFTTARNLFLREAQLLAQLSHPNVVHVQTLFEENGTAYMAMDFIHGQDLQSVISDEPEMLTAAFVLELSRRMLDALEYLHDGGLLHRDIKPSNIRIDRFRRPILIDFGAARQQTRTETRKMGTFRVVSDGYSPSEFYTTGAEQSAASDLYALAATLYHAITGEAPPAADVRNHKLVTSEPDPYQPLYGRYPDHSDELLMLIDRSMAISMKERPQSAKDWLIKLNNVDRPQAPPPPVTPVDKSPAPKKGGLWGGVAIGGLAGAVIAGGAAFVVADGGVSEEVVATLETNIASLEAEAATADSTIAGLNAQLADSQSTVATLETNLQSTETDLADALARIEVLESQTPVNPSPVARVGCPDFTNRANRETSLTGDFIQSTTWSTPTTASGSTDFGSCSSTLGIGGTGYVNAAPNLAINLNSVATTTNQLEISVTSATGCDTTLLVNTPATDWFFDDDSNGNLQPRLTIPVTTMFQGFDENTGRLDIWVGTFSQGQSCPVTLNVRAI